MINRRVYSRIKAKMLERLRTDKRYKGVPGKKQAVTAMKTEQCPDFGEDELFKSITL